MNIGDRIVFLREERGISQKDLAKGLHITPATLSRYENNIYQPKLEFIYDMCHILDTSPDYLLGFTEQYNRSEHIQPAINDMITSYEYSIVRQFRRLSKIDQIRIEERICTLLEQQN